jgi:cysteine desulfurase
LHDCNVKKLGVDALTLSAHKVYGPKGVGLLFCSGDVLDATLVAPLITGGGQEQGFRSGTQNVAGMVGCAKALEVCQQERGTAQKKMKEYNTLIRTLLQKALPSISCNGSTDHASPHIINLYVPEKEHIATALDVGGIAVSSGSACSQRRTKLSHVLSAMGYDEDHIKHSVRISMGRFVGRSDSIALAQAIVNVSKGRDVWCSQGLK